MSVKYTSNASEVLSQLKQAKNRALEIIGGTAEGHAKTNIRDNGSVITSRLINGITHQKVDENTMAIGTDVANGPYVELGHNQKPGRYVPAIGKRLGASRVAGKPFLKPALEGHRDEYIRIAKEEYGIR